MSTSMYWRPVPPPVADNQLSSDLKLKIRDRFFHGDWPYGSGWEIDLSRDIKVIGFLEGLAAGGTEDAQELLDLIHQHGKVEIWVGDPEGPR